MSERDRINVLAARYTAAMPELDPLLQHAALTLLRLLGQGAPVEVQQLAQVLPLPVAYLEETLDGSPGVLRDERRRVTGVLGLSVIEVSEHRIHLAGRSLWARCALDALFLPELLGERARVTSRCPTSGAEISLAVTPAGVADLAPPETVVSFLTPEARFDSQVVQSFCDFVYFFASAQAAAPWTSKHPGTYALSVDDTYRLGQLANHASFGVGLDALRTP
jgi:alkylmercury lyase